MTTTPAEPSPAPEVVPSGDPGVRPGPAIEPTQPGEDPGIVPEVEPAPRP